MLNIPTSRRVALLIDADNVPLNHLEKVLNIARSYGNLVIRRAYGDWREGRLSAPNKYVSKRQIKRIQVNRVKKQATDQKLITEACKFLNAGSANIFIIVSGDSDFIPLCTQIKSKGQKVVGIGIKQNTSPSLSSCCNEFHYINS